jgi:hypothetical protein
MSDQRHTGNSMNLLCDTDRWLRRMAFYGPVMGVILGWQLGFLNAAFTSSLTGLTSGTKYWVNAYATNSVGTGYANDGVSFGTLYASGVTTTGTGGKVTFTGTGGKVTIK